MSIVTRLLFLALILGIAQSSAQNSTHRVKPKTTRTSLHVARSLDPSASELLQVRAKNGEMATLIVKRRNGKNSSLMGDRVPERSPPLETREPKSKFVPPPVQIHSDVVFVKDEPQQKKKGRGLSPLTVENGVPVIEGIRMPDSPEDKFHTWRNAKVINGVLVPYKQSLNSEIPLKPSTSGDKGKPEKQELLLSSYFETKERPPSMFGEDDAVKTQWKGIAETIPVYQKKPVEKYRKPIPLVFADQEKNHAKIIEYINRINQKEVQNRKSGRSVAFPNENSKASRRMDENVDENEEPIWINVRPQEMWTEDGKVDVADRRMDTQVTESNYITGDKFIPITPAQDLLLQSQGISSHPTSLAHPGKPSRVSFEDGVRTPVLQYAHPELGAQPVKVDREAEEVDVTKGKPSSLPSLRYFLDDPHADRSPYAREPGLNSVSGDSPAPSPQREAGASQERQSSRHQSVRNIEFTTSQAESSSSVNPDEIDITESPNGVKAADYFADSYGQRSDNQLQSYQHFGHPGKYFVSKEDYYKWKMSGMSYNKNSLGPGEYYVRIGDNRSFLEKLTDGIRESVQTGVENMKEMTRPVMEPIVEATQRISENLGIPEATAKISHTFGLGQGTGMRNALQEKIGAAASGSPVLLPALGLVGAGAALGLGAMAVGKLLNVNVDLLKRNNEDGETTMSRSMADEKRVVKALDGLPNAASSIGPKDQDGEGKGEFKRLIGDEGGMEELEKFHFDPSENSDGSKSRRRSLISKKDEQDANEEYLIRIRNKGVEDRGEFSSKLADLERPNSWRNLLCAQKVFCEALLQQSKESIQTLEDQLVPAREKNSSNFVQQVLSAAKSRDCDSFACQTTTFRR